MANMEENYLKVPDDAKISFISGKEKPKEKPLSPKERVMRYINPHGQERMVPEGLAVDLHRKMKKFLGDTDGNMTPPRPEMAKKNVAIDPQSGKEFPIPEGWKLPKEPPR